MGAYGFFAVRLRATTVVRPVVLRMAAGRRLPTMTQMTISNIFNRANGEPDHPDTWPERSGKTRVLIEHPDAAELWAHADTLLEAGYDTAVCPGPSAGRPHHHSRPAYFEDDVPQERNAPRTACPLLCGGHCALAEGADMIVISSELVDAAGIEAAHREAGVTVVL